MSPAFKPVLAAAAAIAAISLAGAAAGQGAGGYTAAQAERGTVVYNNNCAVCHAESLGGGPGSPPLMGAEFMFGWKAKNAAQLFDYIKTMMPPGSAGGLTDSQYADLVAVILKANGHVAGAGELSADPALLKGVGIAAP